jgi:Tfp pilus assembly protein PilE
VNTNRKDNSNIEQIKSRTTRRSARISGLLGFIAIIAIVLYYGISTYLPYLTHKQLIEVKSMLLRIAVAENRYYQEHKTFASQDALFRSNQPSADYNGYKISINIKPDLSNYEITAKQLDSAKTQYPNCNKLVVTPSKYFSYDTFGEISTGCW